MKLSIVRYVSICILGVSVGMVTVGSVQGCKTLTPQEDALLVNTGTTILCALEGEELSDPALDKLCQDILPKLSPEQRTAVQAHLSARKAHRAVKTGSDAGSEGGSQ